MNIPLPLLLLLSISVAIIGVAWYYYGVAQKTDLNIQLSKSAVVSPEVQDMLKEIKFGLGNAELQRLMLTVADPQKLGILCFSKT